MIDTPASGSEPTEIDLSIVACFTFYKASTTGKGKKQTTNWDHLCLYTDCLDFSSFACSCTSYNIMCTSSIISATFLPS
jgi:hypothetical protein